jgi:predicted transcriptional regulator YdeE
VLEGEIPDAKDIVICGAVLVGCEVAMFLAERGKNVTMIDMLWGRIYSKWFPSSNYELSERPEISWNENMDVNSPTFKREIWIPVMKK